MSSEAPNLTLASGEPGVDAAKASRGLRRGLISLTILLAIVVGLLLAVPGLHGVAEKIRHMQPGWRLLGVGLEILSCVGYILAFLQVFDRAPIRFGARVAMSELAFGAAVSLGGTGGVAVGAWLMVDRGGNQRRITERSAVLFLITSAVNVVTLVIAGGALYLGVLPGPRNPFLSIVPASVGLLTFALFLALPRCAERLASSRSPGKLSTFLIETAVTIRLAEKVVFSWDWRTVGAFAYLWCDIGVLVLCFAAAGHVPPIATIVLAYQIGYISNLIPIPGGIGVLDGSFVGMFVLFGVPVSLVASSTVVYHAISLWVPSLWETIAYVVLRRTRGQPIRLRSTPRHAYSPVRVAAGGDTSKRS